MIHHPNPHVIKIEEKGIPSPPSEHPRPLPPVRTMAASLLEAATGTVARLARGQKILRTPEQQAACLAVCKGEGVCNPAPCPEWDATRGRCLKCGCIGRFAAFLAAKPCPLGKWPPTS